MSSNFHFLLNSAEDISDLKFVVVEDLIKNHLTVLKLVESIGPFLTNEDVAKRLQGTSLLASVLLDIPSDLLNENEVTYITTFFCDRLRDHVTIVPFALRGLQATAKMHNLPDSTAHEILFSLSQNVVCQDLPNGARLTYYILLKNLMKNKKDELLKNPGDFVFSIISAMDSESDPRNLMFLFNFLPETFRTFPCKHLSEEAFYMFECYFPVDFNPRDNNDVTRDDLSLGLENCLLSCEDFAPFIIPMILDKLESSFRVAKVDSLKLLVKGIESWQILDVHPHSKDLWDALKALILPSADVELAELSVKAVIEILKKYYKCSNIQAHERSLKSLLNDISTSTHRFLQDPSLSLFQTATKLLAEVAHISPVYCNHVLRDVLVQLIALLKQKNCQGIVLTALCPFLTASVKFSLWEGNEGNSEVESMLREIPLILKEMLSDDKAQSGCFMCFKEIISILTEDMRRDILCSILNLVYQGKISNKTSCEMFVRAIAEKHPEQVKSELLAKLTPFENNDDAERKLEIFGWCCNVRQLMMYSTAEILRAITSSSYSAEALARLRYLCENSANTLVLHYLGVKYHLVEELVEYFVQNNVPTLICMEDNTNLQDISKIIESIMRSLSSEEQAVVISVCLGLFCPNNSPEDYGELTEIKTFLLKGLLIPLHKDVEIKNCPKLIAVLTRNSLYSEQETIRVASSLLLASIINKYKNVDGLEPILKNLMGEINTTLGTDRKIFAVELLSWLTKCLILRGLPSSYLWLDKLIELLSTNNIQVAAAKGFKVVLSDCDELREENHCNFRILYKQRVFTKINQLIALMDKSEGETTRAILMAIAYILHSVPKVLIIEELKQLLKVIVRCIECPEHNIMAAVLEVLCGLLEAGESVFEDYIDTFVPRCIQRCYSQNMRVRMLALDCVYHYGKYCEEKILPYRSKVLRDIQGCLDDKKRLVRQKAVRARMRWFLVGSSSNN